MGGAAALSQPPSLEPCLNLMNQKQDRRGPPRTIQDTVPQEGRMQKRLKSQKWSKWGQFSFILPLISYVPTACFLTFPSNFPRPLSHLLVQRGFSLSLSLSLSVSNIREGTRWRDGWPFLLLVLWLPQGGADEQWSCTVLSAFPDPC